MRKPEDIKIGDKTLAEVIENHKHWRYDKDTATEIKFLERLYDKVSADMKGGQG